MSAPGARMATPMMRRITRAAVAVVLVFGATPNAAVAAQAAMLPQDAGTTRSSEFAEAPTTSVAAPASKSESNGERSRMMLVLDSSGSMAQPAGDGMSKIQAAKKSLSSVIDTMPANQQAGLRVYGAEIKSPSNPNACTDSQLVVPIGTDNRDALRDAVAGYQPVGETPIGHALLRADADLGNTGKRNIVLVSDGEATCQPAPCGVAERLHEHGVEVRIDVVGLDVDGSAQQQLTCVAKSGGGIYYDADTRKELTDSLTKIAERAARPYEEIGEPVTGTSTPGPAPTIDAGDWADAIPPAKNPYGEQRIYKVRRHLMSSTLTVSAALRAPDGTSNLDLSLQTPNGTVCDDGSDSELFTAGMLLSVGAASGQLMPAETFMSDQPDHDTVNGACLTARKLYAVVSYGESDTRVPVELRVDELPAITNLDDLESVTETPEWEPPKTGSTAVTGGTSFGNAENLEPGGYAGTIVPGETLTYSVDVDWGEQLNVAAGFDKLSGAVSKAGAGDPEAHLQIFGPSRLPAGTTDASTGLASDATISAKNGYDPGPDELGLTTGPVTYKNIGYNTGAAQAGTYTITLFLEDSPENDSIPVPYHLGIDITGEPVDGPDYDEQPIGSTDTDDGGDGDQGAGPGAGDAGDGTALGPGDNGGSGVSPFEWIIGLALFAAVVFALLLTRRRRPHPAPSSGPVAALPPATSRSRDVASDGPGFVPPSMPEPLRRGAQHIGSAINSVVVGRIRPLASRRRASDTTDTAPDRGMPPATPVPAVPTPTVSTPADVLAAAHGHGLGLDGPGAPGLARALLTALLANGRRVNEAVEVVIPGADLAYLLDHQVPEQLPRELRTAASLGAALDWLETEILTRARRTEEVSDNHGSGDASSDRRAIVLITRPAPGVQQRLGAVLDNGADHDVTGLVLGDWRPDHTITIAADGMITHTSDRSLQRAQLVTVHAQHAADQLARIAATMPAPRHDAGEEGEAVDPALDLDRLEILHPTEDETRDDAGTTGAGIDRTYRISVAEDGPADDRGPDGIGRRGTTSTSGAGRAPVLSFSVFGPPTLVWHDGSHGIDITDHLGTKQLELLSFLALHPTGERRDAIVDTLWPDSPVDRPANALQLTHRRLRDSLEKATEQTVTEPLLMHDGRYRLNPDIFDVDYWRFTDTVAASRSADNTGDRQDAYEEVVAIHTGPLGEGLDADWIHIPRQDAQHEAINAVARLARDIVDNEPERTLNLLDTARIIAPDNESIYRDIMRLQSKLGHTAAISSTLRIATTRLAENDAQLHPTTIELGQRLQ